MAKGKRLVVGTGNPGKVKEIAAVLAASGIEPVTVGSLVADFDPIEDGDTFAANARIKAEAAMSAVRAPAFADDSGLCVVGLDLAPGVHSSRYAGPGKSDSDRIDYLLAQMAGMAGEQRKAWFACVICALVPRDWLNEAGEKAARESAFPGYVELVVEGRLDGRIGLAPQGSGGFGYDPVFMPEADPTRSLAQFSMTEKNLISHRGRALTRLKGYLKGV